MQGLDDVIRLLEEPNEFDAYLHELGAVHARFVQRGFHAGMWPMFKEAIVCTIEGKLAEDNRFSEEQRQQAEIVWEKFARLVVEKMYVGFAEMLVVEYCAVHCCVPITVNAATTASTSASSSNINGCAGGGDQHERPSSALAGERRKNTNPW